MYEYANSYPIARANSLFHAYNRVPFKCPAKSGLFPREVLGSMTRIPGILNTLSLVSHSEIFAFKPIWAVRLFFAHTYYVNVPVSKSWKTFFFFKMAMKRFLRRVASAARDRMSKQFPNYPPSICIIDSLKISLAPNRKIKGAKVAVQMKAIEARTSC